ncbi:expressed unknown protein [Seminavis robusta]|uniref:Uncharacterized protein n=1 Tax=Seminavis robusta TaxID=568900 RepID=A0A9N8ETX9_9STRA|nr:expressed unknown protein [Seminavis robusta]|eukprot:Sro1755_g295490.1 n/a (224) ;mRNA; r:1471-2142
MCQRWMHQGVVVTAPTVVSSYDDDYEDGCDTSETDSCCFHVSSDSSCSVGFHCVSFDLVPQIHEVPNRFSYTGDEMEATWYGRREKDVMREAAFGIAESLDYYYFLNEFGQPVSTKFRGLESYTVEGSKQRKLNRVKNLVSVLREQRRQRSCGEVVTNGPVLLEAACRSVSSQCEKQAYVQGIMDEKDALGTDRKPEANDESPSVLLHFTKLLRDLGQSSEHS